MGFLRKALFVGSLLTLLTGSANAEKLTVKITNTGVNQPSVSYMQMDGASTGWDPGMDVSFLQPPAPSINFYLTDNYDPYNFKTVADPLTTETISTDYVISGSSGLTTTTGTLVFSETDPFLDGAFDDAQIEMSVYDADTNALVTMLDVDEMVSTGDSYMLTDIHAGNSYYGTITIYHVPEPSTIAGLAGMAGLATLYGLRKRKFWKSKLEKEIDSRLTDAYKNPAQTAFYNGAKESEFDTIFNSSANAKGTVFQRKKQSIDYDKNEISSQYDTNFENQLFDYTDNKMIVASFIKENLEKKLTGKKFIKKSKNEAGYVDKSNIRNNPMAQTKISSKSNPGQDYVSEKINKAKKARVLPSWADPDQSDRYFD